MQASTSIKTARPFTFATIRRAVALVPIMMYISMSQALAAGTATSQLTSGADNVLGQIQTALTGKTAATIATIALIFFGFMYMTSEDNSAWKKAGKYLIGFCLIFGAANIVNGLLNGFGGATL